MITLKRPLCFLDIESTGLDRKNDRIVEIAVYKVADLAKPYVGEWFKTRLNPQRPIPKAATDIHGILDAHVAHCPTFFDIRNDLFAFIDGCDVAGYGSNYFDVPLLYFEFDRAGIHWDTSAISLIDAGNLFKIQESRHLSNATQFYCGKPHLGAHSAESDVTATVEVLVAQLNRYRADLPTTVEELDLYTNFGHRRADMSGRFIYNKEGVCLLNFGPYKGQPALEHRDYLEWMYYQADFSHDTNLILADLLEAETDQPV